MVMVGDLSRRRMLIRQASVIRGSWNRSCVHGSGIAPSGVHDPAHGAPAWQGAGTPRHATVKQGYNDGSGSTKISYGISVLDKNSTELHAIRASVGGAVHEQLLSRGKVHAESNAMKESNTSSQLVAGVTPPPPQWT